MDTVEPDQIIAGDSISWRKLLSDYPASAGWALSYALRGPGKIDIDAAADDDGHLIQIGAAATVSWAAGFYTWTLFAKLGADRYTVAQGAIEILADPAAIAAGVDQRPHCKKVLDAIEALLEGKASRDQREFEIDGVRISRMEIGELLRWRTVYRREWSAYLKNNQVAKGKRRGNRVLVRFSE
jgi:hypothetical protein